jgi:enoyl-CoA hydratase/carnithine racemase
VLSATLDVPPLNFVGPEIVRDLVALVQSLEAYDDRLAAVLFASDNPDFFGV